MVKMIKLLSIVIAVLTVTTFKAAAEEEVYSIVQKLDHFNYSDTRTIETSYVLNTEFYKRGGPLFVYINVEFANENKHVAQREAFNKLTKEHNGAILLYDNRYDGYTAENFKNIQYFTVEQNLADLSFLIRLMKKNRFANAKVILFGASISGSIATWFRKLYPELANGVWASSAPLLAKADFSEYYEFVAESIKELSGDSGECYDHMLTGFAQLESMLAKNHTAEVKKMFNLCPSFDGGNDLDVSVFFFLAITSFISEIRVDVSILPKFCHYVMEHPSDVSAIAQTFLDRLGAKPCINVTYRSYVDNVKNSNELPLDYMKCNSFGWFITTSPNQPFGSKCPLSFFTTFCKDLFGDKYTVNDMENNIREFNDFHGGSDLNLENVYFTYGTYDPWRALGLSDEDKTTIITEYGNGDGFPLPESEAAGALDASHKKLSALVKQWLKQ